MTSFTASLPKVAKMFRYQFLKFRMLQDVIFWAQYNNEALIKTLLSLEFEFISTNVRKVVFGVFSDLPIRYQFLTSVAY